MNKKTYLIILTGLPAAGKSTFAYILKEFLEQKTNVKIKIVDPDEIRNRLTGKEFIAALEGKVRRESLQEVKKYLENEYIVISDDLNYYTSMRHDLKAITENLGLPYFLIYINTPLNVCLKWNEERGKPIPNSLIHEISKKFDKFHNYEWEKPDKQYDLSKFDIKKDLDIILEDLYDYIKKELENSNEKVEKKHKVNIKEKADIITRQFVGQILSKSRNLQKKEKLLEVRRNFIKSKIDSTIDERDIENLFKKYIKKNTQIDV